MFWLCLCCPLLPGSSGTLLTERLHTIAHNILCQLPARRWVQYEALHYYDRPSAAAACLICCTAMYCNARVQCCTEYHPCTVPITIRTSGLPCLLASPRQRMPCCMYPALQIITVYFCSGCVGITSLCSQSRCAFPLSP